MVEKMYHPTPDISKTKENSYLGNHSIKRDGVVTSFSAWQVQEYAKCLKSPTYFAKTYLKVIHLDRGLVPFDLYPYQSDMFDHFNSNRFSIVLACRQSGKSISSVAYLLWYAIFHSDQTIAILANKGSTAREMLSRVTLMLENLPFFLQPGCKSLNKGNIDFSNNSRIITAATSGSSIRGMSCVAGHTKICIEDGGHIFYTEIDRVINKSKLVEVEDNIPMIQYCVYKITNNINGKIYVGFHKTNDLDDGYMGSGKLIKRAIVKYGVESFTKDILKVFDNKEDAEAYEAHIVDRDFTLREDTYNLAIGGNVRITYGENNGFHGRKHSTETKKILSNKAKGRPGPSGHSAMVNGEYCDNIGAVAQSLNIEVNPRNRVLMVCGDPTQPDVYFLDDDIQSAAEKFYSRQRESLAVKRAQLAKNAHERFKGVSKTKEHRERISTSLLGGTRSNHHNTDPEKIRKTAEKHRGMIRSTEARKNMSDAKIGVEAKNKGKKYYRDPETNVGKYFAEGDQPIHFVRGTGERS